MCSGTPWSGGSVDQLCRDRPTGRHFQPCLALCVGVAAGWRWGAACWWLYCSHMTTCSTQPCCACACACACCLCTLVVQPDLVSGYGYDLLWSPACAWNATAVIHKYSIGHSDTKSASGSISKPNFSRRAMAEAVLLFDRASTRGIRQIKPAELGEMQS